MTVILLIRLKKEAIFGCLKFNAEGALELEWSKTYGGSGDDRGHSLSSNGRQMAGICCWDTAKVQMELASNNEGQHDNWISSSR